MDEDNIAARVFSELAEQESRREQFFATVNRQEEIRRAAVYGKASALQRSGHLRSLDSIDVAAAHDVLLDPRYVPSHTAHVPQTQLPYQVIRDLTLASLPDSIECSSFRLALDALTLALYDSGVLDSNDVPRFKDSMGTELRWIYSTRSVRSRQFFFMEEDVREDLHRAPSWLSDLELEQYDALISLRSVIDCVFGAFTVPLQSHGDQSHRTKKNGKEKIPNFGLADLPALVRTLAIPHGQPCTPAALDRFYAVLDTRYTAHLEEQEALAEEKRRRLEVALESVRIAAAQSTRYSQAGVGVSAHVRALYTLLEGVYTSLLAHRLDDALTAERRAFSSHSDAACSHQLGAVFLLDVLLNYHDSKGVTAGSSEKITERPVDLAYVYRLALNGQERLFGRTSVDYHPAAVLKARHAHVRHGVRRQGQDTQPFMAHRRRYR